MRDTQALDKVRVIVWDVDGTLYNSEQIAEEIYKSIVQQVASHKNISFESARTLIDSQEKKGYNWGKSAEKITGIHEEKFLATMEDEINKSQYLKRDDKLVNSFQVLTKQGLKHYILTNSTAKATTKVLSVLGLLNRRVNIEQIFTLDSIPALKPDPSGFRAVIKHSRLKPLNHLMVGDNLENDILPAKKLGMLSCFVTSEPSNFSSFNIVHPHNLPQLFSK